MRTPGNIAIIGSGINSLVAAAELAIAGKRVCLVERQDRLGGFIHSANRTLPRFTHDTYSSYHPLFVSGAAYKALGQELHARGLEYCNSEDAVTASVGKDPGTGKHRVVIAHRDPQRTVEALTPADKTAYLSMLEDLKQNESTIFGAFSAELRSPKEIAKLAAGALKRNKIKGNELFLRDALMSGRNYLRSRFDSWEADQLWSPWLLHAGLSPDSATGGIMLPVMAATMHGFGLPVVKGGASQFVAAFESLLRDHGVRVLLNTDVKRVLVEAGQVKGLDTSRGRISADAVLANVSPQMLYGKLIDDAPPAIAAAAARYQNGRGAMQIHLALSKPLEWLDRRLNMVPLIHISNGSDSTGIACAQAEAQLLPADPTIVVGQQSLLDPSRSPAGQATLWLQLQEVPFAPAGDAAGLLAVANGWSQELKTGFMERILGKLEEFAPGARASVLGWDIVSPQDLAANNPNAVKGDPYGGSAELFQNLLWRPFPSAAGHQTPVKGLWHIGASTHPGPGLSGGSGHLVTRELI
ncbi:phytoene desaturase family protein [Paenarthrobacter sp. NPDC056912]|uniref:phytoene desaturase family protein n=1 Tax=Paenarthrobacter sp. NPDC056912 TaxID=3345965 RepID=UPI00366C5355